MSECKHEYIPGPRQWPNICKHCDKLQSDIEIEELTTQRDALLAACELWLPCLCMPNGPEKDGHLNLALERTRQAIAKTRGDSNG